MAESLLKPTAASAVKKKEKSRGEMDRIFAIKRQLITTPHLMVISIFV